MNDQVREFVSRVFPWGETDGRFILTAGRSPEGRVRIEHESGYTTVNDALAGLDAILQRQPESNVYFTVSAQAAGQVRVKKNATNGETEERFRSKEGALRSKVFTLDVDVKAADQGNGKGYASTSEALEAFRDFLAATGLPFPTGLVMSGSGGFHGHWIAAQSMTQPVWQPIANKLSQSAKRFGLKCDTNCTVDVAHIYRLPGTGNFKGEEPREVYLATAMQPNDMDLAGFEAALDAYLTPVAPGATEPNNVISMQTGKPVTPAVTPAKGEAVPRAVRSMAKDCSFIGEGLTTEGRCYGSEPEWSAATMVAVFTEEGSEAAHLLAKGSPYYKAIDTDKKFNEKRTARANGAGWPSCHAIHQNGWAKCQTCPKFNPQADQQEHGAKQSPLHFGTPSMAAAVDRAQAADPEMPYSYERRGGIVGKVSQDEDGKLIFKAICGYPFENGQLYAGMVTALGFDTRIGPRTVHVTIPFTKLASEGMRTTLAEQDMILSFSQAKMVGEFLVAWVTQLQKVKAAVTGEALGWNTENGKVIGFSYNQVMWTPDGPRRTASPEPAIRVKYTPVGSIEPWQEVVKLLLADGRQCIAAIIAASFGAPLIKFMGYGGMLYSAWSTKSGIGKSVANDVALAVWAHPVRAKMQLSDTHNAMFQTMGQTGALPINWDELQDQSQDSKQLDNFIGIVRQITSGKDKSRLDANAKLKETASWNTLLIVTSNASLVQAAIGQSRVSPASMMRVFESEFTAGAPKSAQEKTAMARAVGKLTENYGRAGEVYAEYLGRNHEAIAAAVAKFQDDVAAQIVQGDDERYWAATIAAILAGAHFARAAGICDIPHKPLKEFLIGELAKLREERKEVEIDVDETTTIEGILAHYIRDNQRRHFIATDTMPVGQGKPAPVQILEPSDERYLETVSIQYAIGPEMLRMTVADFDRWLVLNRYTPGVIKKKLKTLFKATVHRAQIAAGTKYGLGREGCIDIPVAGTGLAETLGAQLSSEKVVYRTAAPRVTADEPETVGA